MSPAQAMAAEVGTETKEGVGLGLGARRCSRCSRYAEGVPYWRRPGRLGALVGASALTYGVGGLVCHGLWGGRRYCPHCGLRWTPVQSWDASPGYGIDTSEIVECTYDFPLDCAERAASVRRLWRVQCLLFLAMGILSVVGATDAIVVGHLAGVLEELARLSFFGGMFVMASLARDMSVHGVDRLRERKVLALAGRGGGMLSLKEVSTRLGISLGASEKVLTWMHDGFRVRLDLGDDGEIRYEFPEFLYRKKLPAPDPGGNEGTRVAEAHMPVRGTAARTRRPNGVRTALARGGKWLAAVRLPRGYLPVTAAAAVLAALAAAIGAVDGDMFRTVPLGAVALGFTGMALWPPKRLAEKYRRAAFRALHEEVFELAERGGGLLTVSEVAAELDLNLDFAEKLMIHMDDGSRVRSDISDEGVIYYEFPEFLDREEPRASNQ